VGSVIGVIFGAALSLPMNYLFKVPAVLSVFWLVTALTLCAMIGVVSGVYPA
jgi:preprotein translocase subunit SecG